MVIPAATAFLAAVCLAALGVAAGWTAARSAARLGGRFTRHRCNGVTVWDGALSGGANGAEVSLYLVVKRRTGAAAPVVAPQTVDAPAAR